MTIRQLPSTPCASFVRVAGILAILAVATPQSQAQRPLNAQEAQAAVDRAQYQEKLQQIAIDKAAYAGSIVARWEDAAKASGRWDPNFANDLQTALMKLTPDNLLAAGEASSFEGMMNVLATGKATRTVVPNALGDVADDMVYTPWPPAALWTRAVREEQFRPIPPKTTMWTAPPSSRKAALTDRVVFRSELPKRSR